MAKNRNLKTFSFPEYRIEAVIKGSIPFSGAKTNSKTGMTNTATLPSTGNHTGKASVSSTKRALVLTILSNGTVCTLSQDEMSDRKDWED